MTVKLTFGRVARFAILFGAGNIMAFKSLAGPRTSLLQRFDPDVRLVLPNLPLRETTNSQETECYTV
jgi:hypothetical protein